MWKKFESAPGTVAPSPVMATSDVRKPGSTIRDESVFRDAYRIVWGGQRDPSPCPCKSKECSTYHSELIDNIATIKTHYNVPQNTIIGVSGMGHVSAQSHVVPERKDESNILNYLRTAIGGAGGR